MKKIYGFLGAVALLTMASCAKDDAGGEGPQGTNPKGDLYMSMTISQSSSAGSRTATPNQGVEVGKDRENTVSTAMIIFAKEDKVFKVIAPSATTLVPNDLNKTCAATFEVSRQDLLNDIDNNGGGVSVSYDIYVIANPSDAMTAEGTGFKAGDDIQSVFELAADANTYWSDHHFLMSNAKSHTREILKTEIPEGTHTTAAGALDLGEVEIQRAMSRFDITTETDHTVFTIVNGAADPEVSEDPMPEEPSVDSNDIRIEFDAVALINQATKVNLYKVTSSKGDNDTEKTDLAAEWSAYKSAFATTLLFNDEKVDNYVFSPIQTAYTRALFNGTGDAATGVQGGTPKAFTDATFEYTLWSTISNNEEDNTYTHPGSTTPNDLGAYRIWRYCMENTNYDKENQVHGNTTGVIFRAKMTGTLLTGSNAVYAYNSVILGDAKALKAYATAATKSDSDDSGVFDIVKIRYNAAVMAAVEENKKAPSADEWTFEDGFTDPKGWQVDAEGNVVYPKFMDDEVEPAETDYYAMLDLKLVDREFTIYRPDAQGNFYCYYTYYNRHNDNTQNTIMGPMEFATVRNNVYKLAVTGVYRLGHPGNPGDDPDPEDPGTPDEEDHLYLSVRCKILPWEVRINGIEF